MSLPEGEPRGPVVPPSESRSAVPSLRREPMGCGGARRLPPARIAAAPLADRLKQSKSVIIVPGYGMAVARVQHAVRELTEVLRARGVLVRFAIHPVAQMLFGDAKDAIEKVVTALNARSPARRSLTTCAGARLRRLRLHARLHRLRQDLVREAL
ncbi:MAG TPA: NAD(P)(+) transhydrogenase (Re/Si-specific) subunit beta [Kofleriaceae bacterium]|nr:NAD(P)(+) transhydrogenase (Re/Si-specific) subunit beta [Kofleriaceae bacterium]